MRKILFVLVIVASLAISAYADDAKAPAKPPANVVAGKATSGMLSPSAPFVGTVRFSDISSVAAESSGKIRSVRVDDGDIVSRGSILAVIDSELLKKSIAEAEAGLDQIEANLQLAKNDFERTEKLFSENATSEQAYDNKKYAAIALEKQKAARIAGLENLKAQLSKKIVYAPFNGVVITRKVSDGEWVNAGSVIADIARTDGVDIIVNVPEMYLKYMKKGLVVEAEAVGNTINASFHSIIPAGDTVNRTFPVKFRTKQSEGLLDGMEAKVSLPASAPAEVLFVNRDAIVKAQGNVFVYTIAEGKAKVAPVTVVGYQGQQAGVKSPVLKPDMTVIVKGNERLRPEQPVNVIGK